MATTAPDQDRIDPEVLKRALILVVGFLAVIFDTTIVSVALHTLATQLHASVPTIQWVTTGYLLALAIAVPLSTWGLRRFGGKRLWLAALTVFLIGSIGSSLAWNVGSLIAWRVVQGAGGGIMFPLLTTLIMQAAGGRALGRTVTIVALPALLGPILGPLIGGAILTHLSWRFMFWVNVPFCAAGLILAARFMPADKPGPGTPRPRLDLAGLALLAPGVAAVILGLSNAGALTASPTPMSSSRSRSVWRLPPPSPHTRCAWPGGTGSRSSTSGCSPAGRSPRRRRCCSSPGSRCMARCSCCRSTTRRCAASHL